MRGRGVPARRGGAGGRFSPFNLRQHGKRWQVFYPRYRLNNESLGVSVEGGLDLHLTPGNRRHSSPRGGCMSVDEDAIRQLAQLIWETEGRPEGRDSRHWEMATKLAESAAMAPTRASHRHTVDTLFPAPDSGLQTDGEG